MEQAERDTGKGIMLDLFAPSLAGDERLRRAWLATSVPAATPGSTEAIVRLMFESDVREVLSAIRVPTLVIQRADVPGHPVGHGRYLAEHIPNARYVELPGTDNLMWAGDQDAIVAEIQDFVTGVRPVPDPRRVLAAVLFTDIVGSTEVAARLGDARWEALLADHNGVVRRELDRFGGKEIKIVGDGLPRHVRRSGARSSLRDRDPGRRPRPGPSRSGPGSMSVRSRSCRTTSPVWGYISERAYRPRPAQGRSSY